MQKVLMVLAHPNKESLTYYISSIYQKEKQKNNYSVDIIDLYRCEYKQDFYNLSEDQKEERKYFQNKISVANEIVFIFPYWWGSIPAILKNWLDCNFTTNYAYTYKNSRPVGLLTGKEVRIFTTTGAPKFYYDFTGANRRLKNMWKEQIINFCGMQLSSFTIFGGIDTKFKNIDKIAKKVHELANK